MGETLTDVSCLVSSMFTISLPGFDYVDTSFLIMIMTLFIHTQFYFSFKRQDKTNTTYKAFYISMSNNNRQLLFIFPHFTRLLLHTNTHFFTLTITHKYTLFYDTLSHIFHTTLPRGTVTIRTMHATHIYTTSRASHLTR